MTWKPLQNIDGYLPIEDHGLIGDGATAALVGRDGTLSWLCVPRFDSPPLFCGLLDADRGGGFTVAPEEIVESRQMYESDTAVLTTEMRCRTGVVRLMDFCPLMAGADLSKDLPATRNELLRNATVLEGSVRLRVFVQPRGGAEAGPREGGLRIRCENQPDLCLYLGSTVRLTGLQTMVTLKAGQSVHLLLCWRHSHAPAPAFDPTGLYEDTVAVWRNWLRHWKYQGPQASLVRRSVITIKLLDHFENGAIVAAPTSSLPELIGGARNWDYRYAWVRDAAFSVYALHRVGFSREAAGFSGLGVGCRRAGWKSKGHVRPGRPDAAGGTKRCRPGRLPWLQAGSVGQRRGGSAST